MASKWATAFLLFLGILAPQTGFAQAPVQEADVQRFMLQSAMKGNTFAVQTAVNAGYSVDALDAKGNTALCVAVFLNDVAAYNVLRDFGANTTPSCINKIPQKRISDFCTSAKMGAPFCRGAIAKDTILNEHALEVGGTVLLAGGVVAALAASGGGSDGDSNGGGDAGSGTGGDANNPSPEEPSIEDCVAGEYWTGSACVSCAVGATSAPQSNVCVCEEGTWNSSTNICDVVEKVSEKIVACLGGVWNEVTGKCTCSEGMSLIGGVCIQPIEDEFQTQDVSNARTITLTDEKKTALLAEIGADAENSGTIEGVSDAGLTGIRVAGVDDSAAVTGDQLTKDSEIDLSKASQGKNTGTISLAHETTAGESLYGIHASSGATVSNTGDITINSLSKEASYGVYIDGAGHSFDNQGKITLNVGGETEKIYGIAADDRNVTNSGTIDVKLASDLENIRDTKSIIAGMQGGTLTNKGQINFDTSKVANNVGVNFAGLSLEPFGTAINEAGAEINLAVSNVVGSIIGMRTVDGAALGSLINKGKINITGALHRNSAGAMSVMGMYQQKGQLQNFGEMIANLDTQAGGQMFFMKNGSGDVINEVGGLMQIDLSQKANSSKAAEIVALATSLGNLTNKGQIIINSNVQDGAKSSGNVTAMNSDGSGNTSNEGLIQIISNASNVSLSGMFGNQGIMQNSGTIKLETTGDTVSLSSMSGSGGGAVNAGEIILNHFGTGVGTVKGASGGNDGIVTINTKDAKLLIEGFASIGAGVVQEKDAAVNINLFGNTTSQKSGIVGFKSTGTTENAGQVNIRTNDGYLSNDDVAAVYGDGTYRRDGSYFGRMFGMLQSIHFDKDSSDYKGASMKNSGNVNIFADGDDSSIYGMATLKGYIDFSDSLTATQRNNLLHGRLDPENVAFTETSYGAIGKDSGDRHMVNSGNLNIHTETNTSVIGMLGAQDEWTVDGQAVFENSIIENTGQITITALGDTNQGMIVPFDKTPAFIPYSVIGMATNSSKVDDKGNITYGATNSGLIKINVTGDTRAAGMVAWDNGAAINKGTIEIDHENRNINDITSSYALAWGPQLVGCYSANGGVCVNEGIIQINGSKDTFNVQTHDNGKDDFNWDDTETQTASVTATPSATQFMLSAGDAVYAVSGSGTVDVEDFQIVGKAVVDSNTVKGSNATQYVLSGQGEGAFIGNGDNSALSAVSGSALFDVMLTQNDVNEKGVDIQMTMKSFDEFTDNKSLSDFLTSNYTSGRNGAFFDEMKAIGSAGALTSALNSLTGAEMITRFANEDLTAMRQVNQSMNNMMFANTDTEKFDAHGSLNHFGFKNDNNSAAQYTLTNRRVAPGMKIGYAMSQTTTNTKDGNNSRQNTAFQVFMPISYNKSGWQMIATPQMGYARAHYTRSGFNGSSYDGVIEKRTLALMSEARYPIDLGGIELAPTLEFNAIAYNQKGKEDTKAYSLTMPSDNNLSIEAGLGLHAKRKMGPLDLTAGLMVYREFADPYNIKMGMNGMDGTFNLYDDVSAYRGTASLGFDYTVGEMNMYGNLQHFMQDDSYTNIKTGVKYTF